MAFSLKPISIALSILATSHNLIAADYDPKSIEARIQEFKNEFEKLGAYTADLILYDYPRLEKLDKYNEEATRIKGNLRYAFKRYEELTQDLESVNREFLQSRLASRAPKGVSRDGTDYWAFDLSDTLSDFRIYQGRHLPSLDDVTHGTYIPGPPSLLESSLKYKKPPFLYTGIQAMLGGVHAATLAPPGMGIYSFVSAGVSFGLGALQLWRFHSKRLADYSTATDAAYKLHELANTENFFWAKISNRLFAYEVHSLGKPSNLNERKAWLSFILGQSGIQALKGINDSAPNRVAIGVELALNFILASILNSALPEGPVKNRIRALNSAGNDHSPTVSDLIWRIKWAIEVVESVPALEVHYLEPLKKLQDIKSTELDILKLPTEPLDTSSRRGAYIVFKGSEGKLFRDSIFPHLKENGLGVNDLIETFREQGDPIHILAESKEISGRITVGSKDPETLDAIRRFEISVGSASTGLIARTAYVDVAEPLNTEGVRDETLFSKNVVEALNQNGCETLVSAIGRSKLPNDAP